jgi:hypothetical protein
LNFKVYFLFKNNRDDNFGHNYMIGKKILSNILDIFIILLFLINIAASGQSQWSIYQ